MSPATVPSVTQATNGIVPLTPKENDQRQAAMEPNLEGLLPTPAQPLGIAMNHGAQLEYPLSHSI